MADEDIAMDSPRKKVAYDPDQDPEEKRVLRQKYRVLLKDEEGHQFNVNEYTTQELLEKVQLADSLFDQVSAPQEATLDSAFLLTASNMHAAKARAMKAGAGAFDIDDFVSKLITFMGGRRGGGQPKDREHPAAQGEEDDDDDEEDDEDDEPLNWERIGRKALAKSLRVPVMDFMLGPLAVEQKKRAVGKRAKFEKNKADERRPQELREEDIARSENETTKHVIDIRNLLVEQNGPVNLFRFVINPNDFAQSVENLFYLSFLIRDGECALEIEDDGEPVIFICEQPQLSDYQEGLRKQQLVFEFDVKTWEEAIKVFNITEAIIPQRPKVASINGKWYG
ncbi:Nse4 C-terminal-domain-containing protein [Russula ochroleuca]|uniref:Non-structural maintenance of chromosomes element 4 n=1 Tax=Russula ochroleuca TaxID=152965 RepID=A0A9P5TB91_9AGAM|nr:Nse4 C-terminal-domain-containing protein [Russula ochroleuca]